MRFRINRIFSARRAVAAVLLICSAAVSSFAQTASEKTALASISGKVKIKDKAVVGVIVFAVEQDSGRANKTAHRATTDSTGSYRIANVPAGTYWIRPLAPSFAIDDEISNNSIVVKEGETIEDVNFSMIPGGVITGKISDSDGKPLIEEYVNVFRTDGTPFVEARGEEAAIRTDDRGIYRAYGLQKGKYTVFVGQNESLQRDSRPSYRQTFYPSVTDMAKATDIEVTEGSEAKNIDIVVGRPVPTFKVSGRILDAETERPLPNIKYGLHQMHEHGGSGMVGQTVTNANGEFKLENVAPGKYAVFVVPEESGVRGDSVSFEVENADVVDLVLRAGKAASLSGVVIFEGAETKRTIKLNDLYIHAWMETGESDFAGGSAQIVSPDGSFRIGGLRKGMVQLGFLSSRTTAKPISVVRIERDGVVQPQGVMIKDGEHVNGIRIIVKYMTGTIRGQVKVEGELPPTMRLSVWITRLDENVSEVSLGNSQPQLDSRRRFAVEGVAAGTYQVSVAVYDPSRPEAPQVFNQQVTVADNSVSEVTITIKPKPQP